VLLFIHANTHLPSMNGLAQVQQKINDNDDQDRNVNPIGVHTFLLAD
jgi:hypothetical protein